MFRRVRALSTLTGMTAQTLKAKHEVGDDSVGGLGPQCVDSVLLLGTTAEPVTSTLMVSSLFPMLFKFHRFNLQLPESGSTRHSAHVV